MGSNVHREGGAVDFQLETDMKNVLIASSLVSFSLVSPSLSLVSFVYLSLVSLALSLSLSIYSIYNMCIFPVSLYIYLFPSHFVHLSITISVSFTVSLCQALQKL